MCNAHNHSKYCTCGFGGDTRRKDRVTVKAMPGTRPSPKPVKKKMPDQKRRI